MIEPDYNDTAAVFGEGHTAAAKAAYEQHRAIHRLLTPWSELPVQYHNDWIMVAGRAIQAYRKAEEGLTLMRVLARIDEDEIEFLRDEFVFAAEQELARVIHEYVRDFTTDEEDEWFTPADQCQDVYEVRRFGRIVTSRVTREMRWTR